MRERGVMAVALAAVITLIAVLSVAVASLGVLYVARAQASAAADAAAIAAAVGTYPPAGWPAPTVMARRASLANRATLISCVCRIDPSLAARSVEVVVGVAVDTPVFGDRVVKVAARAEFDPMRFLGR